MTDVDVVIVNYKSAAHTVNCVKAARRAARQDDVTIGIFVVDNGGDAMDLQAALGQSGDLHFISNSNNDGFAVACNAGARLGAAPYILFLNPDALLHEGALKGFTDFLSQPENEATGIVGPEIRNSQGDLVPSCSHVPTFINLILRSTGIHALYSGLGGDPYLPLSRHQSSGSVGQVMGAALMIRRPLFQILSGFDESFFVYYEDVDLCARAKAAGSMCYYLKSSTVTHIGRASSSQDSGFSLALHIRSRVTYARRHFGIVASVLLALTCGVVELPARLIQALLGLGSMPVSSVVRAYVLLVQNIVNGRGLPVPRASLNKQC
ncbi:MAG: glycosyltransferase family 2 protein [Rhodospirillaceae bacterium]